MAQTTDIALTLTSGQLWAAMLAICSVMGLLLAYIYTSERDRTNQRLDGLHSKIEKDVKKLEEDITAKLTAQNIKLDATAKLIQEALDGFNAEFHELDKRLLAQELKGRS